MDVEQVEEAARMVASELGYHLAGANEIPGELVIQATELCILTLGAGGAAQMIAEGGSARKRDEKPKPPTG